MSVKLFVGTLIKSVINVLELNGLPVYYSYWYKSMETIEKVFRCFKSNIRQLVKIYFSENLSERYISFIMLGLIIKVR